MRAGKRTVKINNMNTENNKKIAKFMGIDNLNLGDKVSIFNEPNLIYHRKTTYEIDGLCKWCGNDVSHGHNQKCYVLDESKLLYDSSWDWLMAVIRKIEQLPNIYDEEMFLLIRDEIITGRIEETYSSVVDFVEWYNKTQNGAKEN